MCALRVEKSGEAGDDVRLVGERENDVDAWDCSSEDSELVSRSSDEPLGPRAMTDCVVLRTGLPFCLPSLEGLPGAPSGSRSVTLLGTRNEQLSQASSASPR